MPKKNGFSLDKTLVAVDAVCFREGMSHVAAAVHLVTTDGVHGKGGLTATAVTSVTDLPATLLVCINSLSYSGQLVEKNRVFSVNVLAESDRSMAESFGGPNRLPLEERFLRGQWISGCTGCPVLSSALVSFDCRVVDSDIVASHRVLFGEVLHVRKGDQKKPLLYYKRQYCHLSDKN